MIKLNKKYRKLIARILEDIGDGITPKYNKYSISKECFYYILNYIKSEDLARGMCTVRSSKEGNMNIYGCMNPYLTINGVDYINKNL